MAFRSNYLWIILRRVFARSFFVIYLSYTQPQCAKIYLEAVIIGLKLEDCYDSHMVRKAAHEVFIWQSAVINGFQSNLRCVWHEKEWAALYDYLFRDEVMRCSVFKATKSSEMLLEHQQWEQKSRSKEEVNTAWLIVNWPFMKLHFDTLQKPIDGEQLKCLERKIDALGRCLGESRLLS